MPKLITKLSEQAIRNATPKDKPYKLNDEGGLRLLVRPTGTKVWQFPYKFNDTHNTYTIGTYCQKGRTGFTTTAEARKIRDEIKDLISKDIDPNKNKRLLAGNTGRNNALSFETIASEWHSKGTWVQKHSKNILKSLENDVFPFIGQKHIEQIKPKEIISLLSNIENRNALDVAKRVCQRCEAIFDYAISKGLCENNPAIGRAKFIKKVKTKHRPHLKEHQVGQFLHLLNDYKGKDYIRLAMKLQALTLVRPGELRFAKWEEFNFEEALWKVPAETMKMRREHYVPLSRQVLTVFKELNDITGHSDYLFPSVKSPHKPISDATLTKLLMIMGYTGENKIVPHGFRHTASTILHEHGHNTDFIEKQLAHKDKNKVRSTYNHAQYLDERRQLMQWYADHLDNLQEEYVHARRSGSIIKPNA